MKTAVITGAGSGVGRAIALALAKESWRIALVGRREEILKQTAKLTGLKSSDILVRRCDISDPDAVEKMTQLVQERFKKIDVLVNAAGTNTPQRSLQVLTYDKYCELVNTNLTGAYLCVQGFLPAMRKSGNGTIINIVSDAARQASPKAGPAYVVSKFGLLGLTQSINAEERGNGIRACAILPGDIDTPLLDKRPQPPGRQARDQMLQPDDVAQCALLAINLPHRALLEEILIRPR